MNSPISAKIAQLQRVSFGELNEAYKALFGKTETTSHKTYLLRKIAHRLQEREYGGLSQRAKNWGYKGR